MRCCAAAEGYESHRGWNVATFVLVHGAMHGGWSWREVRERLCSGGHAVYTPTLTGQGDRRQTLTPEVGIATHVTAALLEAIAQQAR